MEPIRQTIQVTFRYDVHFTANLFDPSNLIFRRALASQVDGAPSKALCVIDRGVVRQHPGLIGAIAAYCRQHDDGVQLVAAPLVIEGGEACKQSPDGVEAIHAVINCYGIDRHSYVVAIGGGALLDMAGYAAATAHRGVRLIRVPTTVLAQNDSAVGVKNSINAFDKKNFLGTFTPPAAVLNDFSFLSTLSHRDWRGGCSEAIKVALIKDPGFFAWIERHAWKLLKRDMQSMQQLVYRCAQLHLQHIAGGGDPFEMGSARPLDFGHWAAHKLEQLSGYRLRHGEAVAIGMALDTTYAYLQGLLPRGDWERVLALLSNLRLTVYVRQMGQQLHDPASPLSLLSGLDEFRQHLGGELCIILLAGIGTPVEVCQMDERVLVEAIALLRGYQALQRQRYGGVPWIHTPQPAHEPSYG